MKKLLLLFAVLMTSIGLWAQNTVITYTATEDLEKIFQEGDFGNNFISQTYNYGVYTVTFEDNVTKIGWETFNGCSSLKSITIPASVTTIEDQAFSDCSSLTNVTFAEGSELKEIEFNAFFDCSSLKSITIPASVTTIEHHAFYSCDALTDVTFAEGSKLTGIGEAVFAGCGLTSITIPADVTTIGKNAFETCNALTDVTFTEGSKLTGIGESAFYGCGITSITIPADVTTIGKEAFENCVFLADVTFAEGSKLTEIGEAAFAGCGMTSITIPASVTTIGKDAFSYCDYLTDFTVNWTEAGKIPAIDPATFDYVNLSNVSLHVPFGTTAIYEAADVWKGFTIEEMPMPDYLCFTAEVAGSTVELTRMSYPSPLTIQYSTDEGANWTEVVFTSQYSPYTTGEITLTNVGDKVYFRNAKPASEVKEFSKENEYYYFKMNGKIAASGNVMSLVDRDCSTTQIPYEFCFKGLFASCRTSLTSAPKLPATTLAYACYSQMFWGCTGLTTAPALPATTLADHCYNSMFYGCSSLTEAPKLPATTLGQACYEFMFQGCTGLTTAPELPATTLYNSCYYGMFHNCTGLTTAPELPATTLEQYSYYYMFNGCTNLSNVKVAFSDWDVYLATGSWLSSVSSTGTFVCPINLPLEKVNETKYNHLPSGWDVKVFINVSSCGWASLYYDKALQIPEGVKAYYASAANENTITLKEITGTIPENTAVIISAPAGEVDFPVVSDTGTTYSDNLFAGKTAAETCEANSVYVLDLSLTASNDKPMFNIYTGTSLGAHKAYLPKTALGSSAKEITFVFEDEATGIDRFDVNGQQSTVNSIFNLAGQKVGADYKGIVIVNGKKFMKQ